MHLHLMMAALLSATPAVSAERLECFLTGTGYRNEVYPSGRKVVWFVDGTSLRQHRPGQMTDLPVPMASMRIVRRDANVLIAEWSHALDEGSSYRLVMDVPSGKTTEYSSSRERHRGDDGSCQILTD